MFHFFFFNAPCQCPGHTVTPQNHHHPCSNKPPGYERCAQRVSLSHLRITTDRRVTPTFSTEVSCPPGVLVLYLIPCHRLCRGDVKISEDRCRAFTLCPLSCRNEHFHARIPCTIPAIGGSVWRWASGLVMQYCPAGPNVAVTYIQSFTMPLHFCQ